MKYVTKKDIDKSINEIRKMISFYEQELAFEQEKLQNYTILQDYLIRGGLCPYSKKQLLSNYERFKFYILPLKQKHSLDELCENVKITDNNVDSLINEVVFKSDVEPKNYKAKAHSNFDISVKNEYRSVNIGRLLEDFIQFVCVYKGHKVGIGEFLIMKYIQELYRD